MVVRVVLLLVAVLGCSKERDTPAAIVPAVAAPPLADAGLPKPRVTNPTVLVSPAHYFADDEPALTVDGDHVYWWRAADGEKPGMHRIARTGGPGEPVDGEVVHRGVSYAAASKSSGPYRQDEPVTLYRIENGKRTKLGVAKGGLGGKQYVFDADHVYWIAPWSTGFGSLFATHMKTGVTQRLLTCNAGEDTACPQVLPGSPPVARQETAIYRLEGGRATKVNATCPTDPQSKLAMHATQALGDHVLCEMRDIGWYEVEKKSLPEEVLLPLAGGATRPARGLGVHATFGGGYWYHATDAGILRRPTLDGDDEVVVALPVGKKSWIDALVVDDAGLVWIADDTIYSAPRS